METEVCFHLWCYSQCCLQDKGGGRKKEEKGVGGGEGIGVERGRKREAKGERGGGRKEGKGERGKRREKRKVIAVCCHMIYRQL